MKWIENTLLGNVQMFVRAWAHVNIIGSLKMASGTLNDSFISKIIANKWLKLAFLRTKNHNSFH